MEFIDPAMDWNLPLRFQPGALPTELHLGLVIVNRRTGEVQRPDGQQKLRAKELDLLLHLYQHQATPWRGQELLRVVRHFAATLVTRTRGSNRGHATQESGTRSCRP